MKKIIVTGGSGFIGTNLVNFLIKKKYFVINIDKLTYASNKYDDKIRESKNYKFFKVDINNKSKITEIIRKYKPKAIFNLAAETHVDRSIDNPSTFIHSNINGTFNLLECIKFFKNKNFNIKLVHISTDEVYGDIKKNLRSKENSKYEPNSPYAASKASSDHLIKAYVRTYKINALISNCCNNYGPYQFPEKLIPKMIYNILNKKPLPIYGRGINSREWIYVDDHCLALEKIFKKGKTGNFYNIGSNININNITLIKKLLKIVKTKYKIDKKVKIKFVTDRPGHDLRYAINSNKLMRNLNWKSKINLNDGLKKTFEWYNKNQEYFFKFKKKDIFKRLGKKI